MSPEIPASDQRDVAFRRITSALLGHRDAPLSSDLRLVRQDEEVPWSNHPVYAYALAVGETTDVEVKPEPVPDELPGEASMTTPHKRRRGPRGPHLNKLPDKESLEPAMWAAWKALKHEPRYRDADPPVKVLAARMGLTTRTFQRRRKRWHVALPKTETLRLPGFGLT